MSWPLEEALARRLRPVPALDGRDVARHRRPRRPAEPLEWALVSRGPVDLDVAVAPVADHGFDGLLLADHPLILRADRPEERHVDEAQMVAVAVVLGEHLPVGGAAVLHPAGGQLDPPDRREVARAVDQLRRTAQMLGKGGPAGGEAGEHKPAV